MLEDSDGNSLSHNFRPIQPIGDRVVWFTSNKFHPEDEELHDAIHGKKKSKNFARLLQSDGITVIICILLTQFNHDTIE
jgi:hypothetical protein